MSIGTGARAGGDVVAGKIDASPSARAAADAPPPPFLLDWEQAKVGDRLACFTLFLPSRPRGPVLLAVSPMLGNGVRWHYRDAVLLARTDPSATVTTAHSDTVPTLRWDGRHLPVRPGSAGLIIVDIRHADPDVLRPALAAGGTFAVLGPRGAHIVYPDVDVPENVWQRGWPTPQMPTLRMQVRRAAGLRGAVGRKLVRLEVSGPPTPTLADELLDDLAARTGTRGKIVGVHTAGDTIIRVRQQSRDLAVRVSLTDPQRDFFYGERVVADVPAIRPLVQEPIATGTTSGARWVATEWLPRGHRPRLRLRAAIERQWQVAAELADALEAVPTGVVAESWAQRWSDELAPIVPPDRLVALRRLLDDVPLGTPTGWAHGDLWPGNVLVDHDDAAVIDWENCARDAPLGVDWLLITALRSSLRENISVAAACARLIDRPAALNRPVGGRAWSDWDRRSRAALATAAYVLHLRNRALFDLGVEAMERDVGEVIAVAGTPADPADAADSAAVEPSVPRLPSGGDESGAESVALEPAEGAAGRAARGAVWFGMSAIVSKALQTVILLVLAALLAPSALGLIAIGTLVMNVSTVVSDLGTSSALVYFRGDVRRAARSAVSVAGLLGLGITALAWLVAPALTHVLRVDDEGIDVIRGLTCVLPLQAIATVHLELMRRKLQFARRIVPDLVGAVVGATVAITLAERGHGVASLVIGQIVQAVLVLITAWIVSSPVLPGWNRADVRVLIGYGGHMSGSNLAQLVLLNIDYLIVSRVLGSTALGEYSLAFRLAYLPYLNIAVVIAGAAFPYLCRLTGERLGTSAERITSVTVTGVLPLCVGIALLAPQLELLGEQWEPAVPVVRWLMIYAVILSAGQLTQVAFNASGRPRTTLGLRVLHVAALGVALVILAPHGIRAVAIAQVLAVAVVAAVAGVIAWRRLPGFRPDRLLLSLVPAAIGAAVMAAVVLGLQNVLPGRDVSGVRIVVLGLAGLVAYAVPVWLLDRERLVQTASLVRARR